MQIQCGKSDEKRNHRRMVKIIPLQMLRVGLVINLIITQFQEACNRQPEYGR